MTTNTSAQLHPAQDINTYIDDGFVKVCNISPASTKSKWIYEDINFPVMYSEHKSWVYFMVSGDQIVKIGETGNPLGIRKKKSDQPLTGTRSRLGRYSSFGTTGTGKDSDTDAYVRESLQGDVPSGKVSVWAKQCLIMNYELKVAGQNVTAYGTLHKDLELRYIDHFVNKSGELPIFNKSRK